MGTLEITTEKQKTRMRFRDTSNLIQLKERRAVESSGDIRSLEDYFKRSQCQIIFAEDNIKTRDKGSSEANQEKAGFGVIDPYCDCLEAAGEKKSMDLW